MTDSLDTARARRARQGSRRQRDLKALEAEQRNRHAIPADVRPTEDGARVWAGVVEAMREHLHASSMQHWVEPLRVVGERNGGLCVAADSRAAYWARQRYGTWLGRLVREEGTYRGLFIFDDVSELGEAA